jgi:hypothetical protein
VALLNDNMPEADGLWVCGHARAAELATRALVLTMYDDDECVLASGRSRAILQAPRRRLGQSRVGLNYPRPLGVKRLECHYR